MQHNWLLRRSAVGEPPWNPQQERHFCGLDVADMMVLGTLVAFIFVCIGALRLVNPIIAILGAIGCFILALHLGKLILNVYCVSLPVGLVIYLLYGVKHSKLAQAPVLESTHDKAKTH